MLNAGHVPANPRSARRSLLVPRDKPRLTRPLPRPGSAPVNGSVFDMPPDAGLRLHTSSASVSSCVARGPSQSVSLARTQLGSQVKLQLLWLMQGKSPRVSYEINGNEYDKLYYLVDGIYPNWATLAKTVRNPNAEKTKRFGVLQARWAIVRHPARTWSLKTMHELMTCCVIMHNMIVENERPDGGNEHQ
ncbi:hypothetical protein QYE76_004909 [Lolium multiflorum]|uniref:Protein ALP1-like n=1 Tax=Lolium multiflorum TaxID=4521 RepID=A0AAD8RSZ9_LOLMU|nr:hypothetical protein QYE76_004909 [Lolium multiflorum]